MTDFTMFIDKKLKVSSTPPYDPLQSFVRDNHIALKGINSGALNGLTFSAKDVFKIKGSTIGNGHPDFLRYHEPDEFTSPIITNLLENGADLVGKTVCDELCFSISGENWNYGNPINPYDIRRYTGGSSSGSCASVAGGLVDFSIGSDCLGSVRVPASYNGLIGLRPTYGRVDNEGEAEYCESMDVLGFVAKKIDVFEKIAKIILKEDQTKTTFTKLLIPDDIFDMVDKDVSDILLPIIEKFGDKLENIEHITLAGKELDDWVKIFQTVQGYEVWDSYSGFINKYQPKLSPGPKQRLEFAAGITMEQYIENKKKMDVIREKITKLLQEGSLLAIPTASSIAPLKTSPQEEINYYRAQSSKLLCISPLSGVPSLQLPVAYQQKVPLGISLISAHGTDRALVNFGLNNLKK